MKIKFLLVSIFLFSQVVTATAQMPGNSLSETPKMNGSKIMNSSELFIEKNKNLLQGFDEIGTINTLRLNGVREEVLEEVLDGQKVKFIKNKIGNDVQLSSAKFDATLLGSDNLGFNYNDFTNWEGGLGAIGTAHNWGYCWEPTSYTQGFSLGNLNLSSNTYLGTLGTATPERQVILTCSNCYDTLARNPISGAYEIPYLPTGGSGTTVRLGNANVNSESERLSYNFKVDESNSNLKIKYAIVFELASNHYIDEQPFFVFDIKDSLGLSLGFACVNSCHFASLNPPGFVTLPQGNLFNEDANVILYKKWTYIDYDLSNFIGQKISLEFMTGDCALSAHWGYAYIDASCSPRDSIITFDPGDSLVNLIAPPGFASYIWIDSLYQAIPGGNNDTFQIHNPVSGTSYVVNVATTPGLGCTKSFHFVLMSTVGISEIQSNATEISLHPNPSSDFVNVVYSLNQSSDIKIEIENVFGQKIGEEINLKQNAGKQFYKLSTQQLKEGIYFVTISVNGNKSSKKLLIQK